MMNSSQIDLLKFPTLSEGNNKESKSLNIENTRWVIDVRNKALSNDLLLPIYTEI